MNLRGWAIAGWSPGPSHRGRHQKVQKLLSADEPIRTCTTGGPLFRSNELQLLVALQMGHSSGSTSSRPRTHPKAARGASPVKMVHNFPILST